MNSDTDSDQLFSLTLVVCISAISLLVSGLYGLYTGVLSVLVGSVGTIILLFIIVSSYYLHHLLDF